MLDRFVTKIQNFVAGIIARQINRNHEKWATQLLDQVHLGASIDWIGEIVEIRGRHALAVAHH